MKYSKWAQRAAGEVLRFICFDFMDKILNILKNLSCPRIVLSTKRQN